MWLKTIARTGTDGTASVPLPPLTFSGTPLPNRVETATDLNDGYQPATATFVSPDPLLDPYNPQHLNPYAYAQDDPATLSDPNGKCPVDRCGFGIVNNGIVYRHGPIDPGNPGGAWIPASCAGCGSYPVASAAPLTPYQIAAEIGAMPATRQPPTVTDITYLAKNYGYRGSDAFTIADMIRWLPGAASGWQGDGTWDEFCQGLAGAPESACGTNPFNGHTNIYGDPSPSTCQCSGTTPCKPPSPPSASPGPSPNPRSSPPAHPTSAPPTSLSRRRRSRRSRRRGCYGSDLPEPRFQGFRPRARWKVSDSLRRVSIRSNGDSC